MEVLKKMKKDFYRRSGFWIMMLFMFGIIPQIAVLLLVGSIVVIIYSGIYFGGNKFKSIKQEISNYIDECNELNTHIEELRSTYADIKKIDYGEVTYKNISKYKYKKKGIANAKYAPNIYECSRAVCDSARKQPFKYICKYFNIKANEENLAKFENVLNNFIAAEEGKQLLVNKKDEILKSISKDIPKIIRLFFKQTLEKELGFKEFIFNELYFPKFSFRYISPGGNSGTQFDIELNIEMLERFINYLSEMVKFKKSVEGQRRLMTPKLRKFIIERDKHTCQYCGNSTEKEPNLLLEVDHKVPLAKGGITSEENLQTLCWKCNRSKGTKIISEPVQ